MLSKYAILVLAVCGVASAALWARWGLDAGVSALALSAWRLVLASLVLLVWRVLFRRAVPLPDRGAMFRLGIAGVFLGLHFATWIGSLSYASVARSTLLVATSPLWAGLAGLVIPSLRPRPVFWLGLGVAAVGTWLVTTHGVSLHGGSQAWIGDGLAVIGAICIVPYLVLSQSVQLRVGTVEAITWIYSFAALFLVVSCWLFVGRVAVPSSAAGWGSIVGMALFAQLVGHSLFNLSLRSFSAGQVAASTLLEPAFAALLAWPILGEVIGWWQALGGLLLLLGVGLALRTDRRDDSGAIGWRDRCKPQRHEGHGGHKGR